MAAELEEVGWVTRAQDHRVTIERRGRSHRAVCVCGWTSHAWNELRPAEADAWHHVYGEDVIVDISAIPDERSADFLSGPTGRPGAGLADLTAMHVARSRALEQLVRHAQDLAARPSPYSRDAASELWQIADHDAVLVRSALAELEELLARHDRQSSRAADSEWLQLITAKRLLLQALAYGEQVGPSRALI
jgi:hypothetical protein